MWIVVLFLQINCFIVRIFILDSIIRHSEIGLNPTNISPYNEVTPVLCDFYVFSSFPLPPSPLPLLHWLFPDSRVHGANMGAHLGPTGPRWAPCWPHELCYLGCFSCQHHLSLTLDIWDKESIGQGKCTKWQFHDLDQAHGCGSD